METLKAAFASGTLVHPLEGGANSVELFRAMARLSGVTRLDDDARINRLVGMIGHHDHYLFVIVDGLGMNLEPFFPSGGFFRSAFEEEIRSVFPSTATVALTSLATGLWPAEHGLTGWWTHFPEYHRVIAPLLFRERWTGIAAGTLGLEVADLVPAQPLIGSFFRHSVSFLPHEICGGSYANWSQDATAVVPFRTDSRLLRLLRRHVAGLRGPSYTYLYILTVDALSHLHGTASEPVRRDVRRIDGLLARVRDALPSTVRMVVSTDHGLVDVPEDRRFVMSDEDTLCCHLLGGQSGETSTPVFHVRAGHEAAFADAFRASPAAAHFSLHRPEDLAELRLYGPVPLEDSARRHLGQFVAIARDCSTLEYVAPGHEPSRRRGVHGGLRPAEMRIPLCVA